MNVLWEAELVFKVKSDSSWRIFTKVPNPTSLGQTVRQKSRSRVLGSGVSSTGRARPGIWALSGRVGLGSPPLEGEVCFSLTGPVDALTEARALFLLPVPPSFPPQGSRRHAQVAPLLTALSVLSWPWTPTTGPG